MRYEISHPPHVEYLKEAGQRAVGSDRGIYLYTSFSKKCTCWLHPTI